MPGKPSHPPAPADAPPALEGLDHLVEHLRAFLRPGMVIVCVGNELCGDDGAGPAVARALAGRVPWPVYDCGGVPENYLMKIVGQRPEAVLLVDALDFGAPAGQVELFEPGHLAGQGPSTHGPAPLAFLELLEMMHPCRLAVLGIQPLRADLGRPLSEPVARAVAMVSRALAVLAGSAPQAPGPS